MAILSEYEEEDQKKPTTSSVKKVQFNIVLDPWDPIGFLESVFEFVARKSDLFKSDSLVNDVNGVVRMVKDKVDANAVQTEVVKETVAEKEVNGEGETKEEEKKGTRAPNKGNGLDVDYSWGQSLQEINIIVPVPPGTKSRFIACEIKRNYLEVGLKGQPPIIDGELFQSMKVDDSFWSLEDHKSISILLTKQNQMEWWK